MYIEATTTVIAKPTRATAGGQTVNNAKVAIANMLMPIKLINLVIVVSLAFWNCLSSCFWEYVHFFVFLNSVGIFNGFNSSRIQIVNKT